MDLSEILFPLKFSLLINPGFVEEKLIKAGYYSEESYFMGAGVGSSLHQINLGWAGHTTEGKTMGTVSGTL